VPPASVFDPSSSDPHVDTNTALSELETRVRQQLEALPTEILRHVFSFREHVEYFVRAHVGGAAGISESGWVKKRSNVEETASMPEVMKQLFDDITCAERIPGRIKDEIVQDMEARRTLFRLSIEKVLRRMIDAAEDALSSLNQRNGLAVLHEQQGIRDLRRKQSNLRSPGNPDSPSPPDPEPEKNSSEERTRNGLTWC